MTMSNARAGWTRRNFLKTSGTALAATALPAPMVWAQNIKDVVLRTTSTGTAAANAVAAKAKEDIGVTIQFTALDTDSVNNRVVTQPDSYEIADIEYFSCRKVFPTGVLQPMDTKRIKYYDEIVPLFKTGKLTPDSQIAQGTAPHTVGFVEGPDSTTFADSETEWMTLIPTTYNADTLGIRTDMIDREITSWADIMDPEFKGRAALVNIPSIGIMDAAMILEAQGVLTYGDKGNMTRDEIDQTVEFLIKAKRDGQFRALWKSFDESVNLMTSGEVVIQSMWSPAVAAVRSQGIPCVYQPLKEGYRAWGGGMGLARGLDGLQKDAAYEYINWYLSGWAGAYLNREGYYSGVLSTAKQYMTENEWGFWMEGKPATAPIVSPEGVKMEDVGAVRDGGSFEERMGNVACWNSTMDEDRYMVMKWNEFVAA
ncbi:ABC transporter substrate-binding protein [Sagittula stellata]|uniref:ABC transporter, binding protein n=1 Tax=Sagittula stellata (strain ATCC 700073 / DSM 11524 / E-37) TaxID=388399 RepID=A3K4F3_SAGS3|nr:ABC transporter, binding protein [Sagittula stellata E-37]